MLIELCFFFSKEVGSVNENAHRIIEKIAKQKAFACFNRLHPLSIIYGSLVRELRDVKPETLCANDNT